MSDPDKWGIDLIRTRMGAYKDAYDAVLDLIDKHIRASRRPVDDQRP